MPQFRAKARAVDLLGKGQISDLPTAISELWKNGYDAYGDKLDAYLYLSGYEGLRSPLFVLSDDGIGMSENDILNKWIVLGTDSKSRGEKDEIGEDTLNKEPRIKMGEKGIGRLSVASLGSPMIMFTKKINQPLQALFFHWRILENYSLFIEDINIPIKTVYSIIDFPEVFKQLKQELLDNFHEDIEEEKVENIKNWKDQLSLREEIINEINEIELPSFFNDEILEAFKKRESHGTSFIIFNPDYQLVELAKYSDKNDRPDYVENSINQIRTTLNGLFNVFKEEKDNSLIKTTFLIKSETGEYDFISSREFFSPSDFESCDHLIDGVFDVNGTFNGKVRIFKQVVDFTFRNNKPQGKVPYGAFTIKLGVSPGKGQATIMTEEKFSELESKLSLFGGLYIYRDNFRVLPYGKTEVDFLNFEKRRTLSAGYYFFSHRRMFGYIEISRDRNSKLKDKAGREGFINNQAYREFKADLEAFFIELAKQYFSTDAKSDLKEKQQTELEQQTKAAKDEKEREKLERKEFAQQLIEYPKELKSVENDLSGFTKELEGLISKTNVVYEQIQDVLKRIEKCKTKANSLVLKKPQRFTPTENQLKKFYNYNKNIENFFSVTYTSSQYLIDEARKKLKEQELLNEYKGLGEYYKSIFSVKFKDYENEIRKASNSLYDKLAKEKNRFQEELKNCYEGYFPKEVSNEHIGRSLKLLENSFNKFQVEIENRIPPTIKYLNRLSFDVDEDLLTGYYKNKFEEIEKQWQETKEMAQLGIAVEIIDHQFNSLYSQLAYTINHFPNYIKNEINAEKSYKALKTSFEHLESKYKLLSPLYRTTGKSKRTIKGHEITDYIRSFFKEQFEDNSIDFDATSEFEKYSIVTYESILFPVFINVIHNAIYWLTPVDKRQILLDVNQNEMLIMNSGATIEDFYLSKIFELFYSKRPNGRGIGLYLAKENLRSVDLDIFATNEKLYNKLDGACFVIKPLKTIDDE